MAVEVTDKFRIVEWADFSRESSDGLWWRFTLRQTIERRSG